MFNGINRIIQILFIVHKLKKIEYASSLFRQSIALYRVFHNRNILSISEIHSVCILANMLQENVRTFNRQHLFRRCIALKIKLLEIHRIRP